MTEPKPRKIAEVLGELNQNYILPGQAQLAGLKAESNPLQTLVGSIYKMVTGSELYKTKLAVTEMGTGDNVIDTKVGRYLVSGDKAILLSTEPIQDEPRYAVVGYSLGDDGQQIKYIARRPDERFVGPQKIGSFTLPGKKVVAGGHWIQ